MDKKDIEIIRMSCATVIHTKDAFFIYDRTAGDEMKEILCIISKDIPDILIKEVEASKIIRIEKTYTKKDNHYFSFSILLSPQFGYTNQKFDDLLHTLFEKYNL